MWDFNWIAVVLAAVAGFMVGGVWYGPLFSKAWMAELGKTQQELGEGANNLMIFGLTFVFSLISAIVLAHVLKTYGDPGIGLSVMISGGVALGFIVPALGSNYLFARRSLRLFLIDGGFWLIVYALMGAIFGLFAG